MSPYKAVFGVESYVGMERLNLPTEQQNKIQTAKQLYSVLASLNENDDLKKGYLAAADEEFGTEDNDDIDLVVDKLQENGLLPTVETTNIYSSLKND